MPSVGAWNRPSPGQRPLDAAVGQRSIPPFPPLTLQRPFARNGFLQPMRDREDGANVALPTLAPVLALAPRFTPTLLPTPRLADTNSNVDTHLQLQGQLGPRGR